MITLLLGITFFVLLVWIGLLTYKVDKQADLIEFFEAKEAYRRQEEDVDAQRSVESDAIDHKLGADVPYE